MTVFRGCLVGCGFVSQFHLKAWARQTRGRLTAVCDLDEARAQAASRQTLAVYTDAAAMLERERPDFVEICTPPMSHAPLVQMAASMGIHALCQKPAAPTLELLDEMLAACGKAGVRFMVHENYRWRAWYVRMRAELQGGRLGKPFRMGLAMHDQRCLTPAGLADQPYFSGLTRLILSEIGPHAIDLARSFFGDPQRVFAVGQHIGPQPGEDVVHVILWFPHDRIAHLDLSWCTAPRNSRVEWGLHDTWIEGDQGTLRTRGDGQLEWFPVNRPSEVLAVDVDPEPLVAGYATTQAHFLECLETGRPFVTDGADTRKTMQTVFAAYESAASRQPVDLPL